MNALSLWQPWASAIALGLKSIETRSWAAPASALGKRIAIAATKTNPRAARQQWGDFIHNHGREFAEFLLMTNGCEWDALPRGSVVCTAKLVLCVPSTASVLASAGPRNLAWGDFSPGRWAWVLDEIQPLRHPVPVVGRQGLFKWHR